MGFEPATLRLLVLDLTYLAMLMLKNNVSKLVHQLSKRLHIVTLTSYDRKGIIKYINIYSSVTEFYIKFICNLSFSYFDIIEKALVELWQPVHAQYYDGYKIWSEKGFYLIRSISDGRRLVKLFISTGPWSLNKTWQQGLF